MRGLKYKLLTFSSILFCLLTGCKVNNGDIGLLYGVWAITEVKVDGEIYTGWKENGFDESFFQFQNNICFVTRTNALYDSQTQVGTWEWQTEDTKIELNFSHYDDRYPNPAPGGYMYGAPDWLLLTQPTVYRFDIEWTDDKHMVWKTVNTEGQNLVYYLKKTY